MQANDGNENEQTPRIFSGDLRRNVTWPVIV